MLDRSFGGVTSALLDEQKTLHYRLSPRAHHVERARRARHDFFCPPPARFIPEGPFIAVHPASAGARAGFPDFVWRDHVWRLRLGFENQKSTAPAALFRFFGERERPETAPKTRLFDRLAPLVASFRAQGGFGRGFVGVGRPNSVASQISRARPQPAFLPRPRGRRPTPRAGPRPTTLRMERQVAGLTIVESARDAAGGVQICSRVSYRPKTSSSYIHHRKHRTLIRCFRKVRDAKIV